MKTNLRTTTSQITLALFTTLALAVLTPQTHAETGVAAWVQRFTTTTGSSVDAANKLATDAAGNVIVVGSSDEGFIGSDMLIIKYSSTGAPLWTNRYHGPANGANSAQAVAVDGSGNVFVAGNSTGTGGNYDYATIKYSSAGAALWTNRYDGSGDGGEYASAVAVDGSGDVVVTGRSDRGGFNYDYATIKYSSAGVPLWTNRYGGGDVGQAIAVDNSGNVVVTGTSGGDFATIKYSSAGTPLWTNRYNGPGNGYDTAKAVAVDATGNVFVTGSSPATNGSSDYATIMYSSAGVPLWTNRYDGPANGIDVATALAVDSNGNALVTGYSGGGSSDWATLKYSSAGVPLWTNRYDGPANGIDVAAAVAVDNNGNVFVTGNSASSSTYPYNRNYTTIKYSSAGLPLWTNSYCGPGNSDDYAVAVAVDNSGNAFVTGNSPGSSGSADWATLKYASTGAPLWTNRYNGPANGNEVPVGVVVDGSGNVFVTGTSQNGTDYGSWDFLTVKYSGAGVPLWTNRLHGGGTIIASTPSGLAVDAAGNVFVTGYSSGDYVTVAYSGAGVPLWTNTYEGPGHDIDFATAIAVDGSGNVFVTGSAVGTSRGFDYATVKYSNAGATLWARSYHRQGSYNSMATAIAVDSAGNVFVTGDSGTLAYSGAGVPLWTNNDYVASAIALDSSGNVFVIGDSGTLAYSGAGVPLWTNSDYVASAIALDSSGNVLVAGSSTATNGFTDYATIKYSGAGAAVWTNRYHGPGNGDNRAVAVAADSSGNVFVTGYSPGTGNDYATIKYSNSGVPLWTNRYNGPANGNDQPLTKSCLAIGQDGAAYVTGTSSGDFATIKYISVPQVSIERNGSVGFFVHISGAPDVTYRLQRAASLTGPWSDLATNTAPASGLIEYHDTSSLPGQAFYRAVQP